jgi:hypothetical protein
LYPVFVVDPALLVVAKCTSKLSIVGHCCCSFLLVADGRVLVVWYWLLNDDKKFVSVVNSVQKITKKINKAVPLTCKGIVSRDEYLLKAYQIKSVLFAYALMVFKVLR